MQDPKLKDIQIQDPNNPTLTGGVSKWNLNPFAHLQNLSDKNEAKLERLQELPKDNFLINSMLGTAELGKPITHSIAHPIETLKNANQLMYGLTTNTVPTLKDIGSQVLNDSINYYGNNLGQHLYEDPIKPVRDLFDIGMLIEGGKLGLTKKITTTPVVPPTVNIPELQGKTLNQIKSIPSLQGKVLDDILTKKPEYTVSDYTNPLTGETDWRLVDEVFRDATVPENIETRQVQHGTMTDFKGELDPNKTGTGSDSGWNGWGVYTTPERSYALDYTGGIPVRSFMSSVDKLKTKIRGDLADQLYSYNKFEELPDYIYNDIQTKAKNEIDYLTSKIKSGEVKDQAKLQQYKDELSDWQLIQKDFNQKADLSIIKPNIRNVQIPEAKYFLKEDELISQQSPEVQAIARQLYKDNSKVKYTDKEIDKLFNEIRGYDLYKDMTRELGSKKKASQLLDAYGVMGYETVSPFKENVTYNQKNIKTLSKEYLKNYWDEGNK